MDIVTQVIIGLIVAAIWAVANYVRKKIAKSFQDLRKQNAKLIQELAEQKSKVHPVEIDPIPISNPEKTEILIFTYTGLAYNEKKHEKEQKIDKVRFKRLLDDADWKTLEVNEEDTGIGQTIRAIKFFPSRKKVYLIATKDVHGGTSSFDSVKLLERYVKEQIDPDCEIIPKEITIDNYNDPFVAEKTYDAVKNIFDSLGDNYKPAESRILVDVTGGTKSMTMGALLASLRQDQNALIIGSQYDEKRERLESFPMLIKFKPSDMKNP
jgi:hypothetical protein